MPDPLFGPEIRLMLAEGDRDGLRSLCDDLHPARAAEALDEFTPAEIWDVIGSSGIRTQAAILEYLPLARQVELVESNRARAAQLIGKMSHDDRVDLLRRVPAKVKESLLRLVDEADRKDIATLFEYGENTVGALMTTDYAWLPPTMSAAEAIDQLRTQAPDKETIYYVYVLDEPERRADGTVGPRRLLGALSLRDLILAQRHALVRDLMADELVTLNFQEDREHAVNILQEYDFIAIPVTDGSGGMLGIVTHDDVIDVIEAEATEDLQRQAGVGRIEGSYLEAGFWTVWRSRITWLAALFVAQMGTITILNHYEDALKTVLILSTFIPLVMSVGGNAGSQAATLVIRALALEQVTFGQWRKVFGRELLMGLALAGTLGVLGLVRTYFFTPGQVANDMLVKLSGTIALTVVGACLWGTLLGAMLPLIIRRFRGDPALLSSPAIATLSDMSAIVIFFNIARWFFGF